MTIPRPDPNDPRSLDDGQLFAIFGGPDESDPEAKLGLAALRKRLFDIDAPKVKIGEYELKDVIGHGGMGKVYRAYSPKLQRDYAIKLIFVAGDDEVARDRARDRLFNEARTMAKATHANVVTVIDVGIVDEQMYLVMELVDGVNLRRWQRQYADDWRAIVARYVEAGRGLHVVHRCGLIHGDVKPDNILVQTKGGATLAKIADFGLARNLHGEPALPDGKYVSYGGTPEYASPEQILDGRCDARSDQYSFCVALFESLNGAHPYARGYDELRSTLDADSEETARLRHLIELQEGARAGGVRWSPRGRKLPAWLRRALERGLSRDPLSRFPDMAALVDAIDLSKRRASRILIGAVAAAGIAATAVGASWVTHERALAPCRLGDDLVGAIWSAERRAALAVRSPAAAAWLDRYSGQWAETYHDICVQTNIDRTLTPPVMQIRRACLDARRDELAAAIDLLGAPEQLAVSALEVVQGIRPVEICGAQLDAVEPPPSDREAEVASIRTELARAYIREVAQDFDTAATISEHALERARVTGYAPLVAEAMYQSGRIKLQDTLRRARRPERTGEGFAELLGAITRASLVKHQQLAIDATLFALKTRERGVTARLEGLPAWPVGLEDDVATGPLTREQRGQLALYEGIRAYRMSASGETNATTSLRAAEPAVRAAIQQFVADGDTIDEARARRNLGDICLGLAERGKQSELSCALQEYEAARGLWTTIEAGEARPLNTAILGMRLAAALALAGDQGGAASLRKQAEAVFLAPGECDGEAGSALIEGINSDETMSTVDAYSRAKRALDCNLLPTKRVEAEMLAVVLALERFDAAPDEAALREVIPIAEALVVRTADPSQPADRRFHARLLRGQVAVRLGDPRVARQSLAAAEEASAALPEAEKEQPLADLRDQIGSLKE